MVRSISNSSIRSANIGGTSTAPETADKKRTSQSLTSDSLKRRSSNLENPTLDSARNRVKVPVGKKSPKPADDSSITSSTLTTSSEAWNDALIISALEHTRKSDTPEETLIQVQRNLRELCHDHHSGISPLSITQQLELAEVLCQFDLKPNLTRYDAVVDPRDGLASKPVGLKSESKAEAKKLLAALVNNLKELTPSQIKQLRKLNNNHQILDYSASRSLQKTHLDELPDEKIIEIGDHVLPKSGPHFRPDVTDINALTLTSHRVRNVLDDHVASSRYITGEKKISQIKSLSDFDNCLKHTRLLSEKAFPLKASKYSLENFLNLNNEFAVQDIGEHSYQSAALSKMGTSFDDVPAGRDRAKAMSDFSATLSRLLEKSPAQGARVIAGMLDGVKYLWGYSGPSGRGDARHLLELGFQYLVSVPTVEQAELLPFFNKAVNLLGAQAQSSFGSVIQDRAHDAFVQLKAQYSTQDRADLRPQLWGMVNTIQLLPPSERQGAADDCMRLITSLKKSKPAFVVAVSKFIVPSLEAEAKATLARQCIGEISEMDFGVEDEGLAKAMLEMYVQNETELSVSDLHSVLDIYEQTVSDDIDFGEHLHDSIRSLPLGELRSVLGRVEQLLTGRSGECIVHNTLTLMINCFRFGHHENIEQDFNGVMRLIRTLDPRVTGKGEVDNESAGYYPRVSNNALTMTFNEAKRCIAQLNVSETEMQSMRDDVETEAERLLNPDIVNL